MTGVYSWCKKERNREEKICFLNFPISMNSLVYIPLLELSDHPELQMKELLAYAAFFRDGNHNFTRHS